MARAQLRYVIIIMVAEGSTSTINNYCWIIPVALVLILECFGKCFGLFLQISFIFYLFYSSVSLAACSSYCENCGTTFAPWDNHTSFCVTFVVAAPSLLLVPLPVTGPTFFGPRLPTLFRRWTCLLIPLKVIH